MFHCLSTVMEGMTHGCSIPEQNCEIGLWESSQLDLWFGARLVFRTSWLSALWPTISTVDWSAGIWFEWNFTFLTTISADSLMHLSGFSLWQSNSTFTYSQRRTSILWNSNSYVFNQLKGVLIKFVLLWRYRKRIVLSWKVFSGAIQCVSKLITFQKKRRWWKYLTLALFTLSQLETGSMFKSCFWSIAPTARKKGSGRRYLHCVCVRINPILPRLFLNTVLMVRRPFLLCSMLAHNRLFSRSL